MKKIILLFIFGFLFKSSDAQIYYPFPTSNAFWLEETSTGAVILPGWCSKVQHTIVGDITINSIVYHKLEVTRIDYFYPYPWMCVDSIISAYPPQYEGAFREDVVLKKVYYVPAGQSNEVLLFDFNVGLNDTMHTDNPCGGFIVSGIDSVLVGGNYHKQYTCSSCDPPFNSIIEGVGGTAGFLAPWCENFEAYHTLLCLNVNNLGVYPDGSSCSPLLGIENVIANAGFTLFPNPSQGVVHVTFPNNSSSKRILIFNSLGEQLDEKWMIENQTVLDCNSYPKGVYFIKVVNGDKISMKKFIRI